VADIAWLDSNTFETIVANTPLVSIDLIIHNASGQVLLGQRLNRPACGYWFVPGGRILKNETLAKAFLRLTQAELGLTLPIDSARFFGLYEHFYQDSVFSVGIDTHYVVNAFELQLPSPLSVLPQDQHSAYKWLTPTELLSDDMVHIHTKWYFDSDKGYKT
jgi:colanic acid biosynthesis protein WcaH